MARPVSIVFITIVALSLSSVARAEISKDEVVHFYQWIKKAPHEMDAAGRLFSEKLHEAISVGNPDNLVQMKAALVDVLLALHRLKADSKTLAVVPSNAGKELLAALNDYFKHQEKTIVESGPEIIRIVADGDLSPADKNVQIRTIVEHNHQDSAGAAASLTKARMAFAREHDLVGEPTIEFREFVASDKSYKVEMPVLTENKSDEANGVKNNFFLAEHKYGICMLTYAAIAPPGEDDGTLQKRLAEGQAGVVKKLNLKVTKESSITLAGQNPGRELEGDLPDKNFTRIRLIMANGRLY